MSGQVGHALSGLSKLWDDGRQLAGLYRRYHPDPTARPPGTGALTTAFALWENGDLPGALSAYDDLVRRFAADPAMAVSVRRGRIAAAGVLADQGELQQTLTRCDKIIAQYSPDSDPAAVTDVLFARLYRMAALAGRQWAGQAPASAREALACADVIDAICCGFGDGGDQSLGVRVRLVHVTVLYLK